MTEQIPCAQPDQWKAGNEFLPYHPQASHVRPDYRDGWNACYRAAQASIPAPEGGPKLDDIEQYRMQMAGISTAALGYWTEADTIHPDYDTVPLRDVAKLYAKYDALYKARVEAQANPPQPAAQCAAEGDASAELAADVALAADAWCAGGEGRSAASFGAGVKWAINRAAKADVQPKGTPAGMPPNHWDEWAMKRAREFTKRLNETNIPPAMLTATVHCALIDAMFYASPVRAPAHVFGYANPADGDIVRAEHLPSMRDPAAYTIKLVASQAPAVKAEPTVREFTNELGNAIRITIEGPNSTSENVLTPMEGAELRDALNQHAAHAEFEVWEGDELFAGTSGPRAQAWAELLRYAAQCEGVVRVFEVSRVERTLSYVPVQGSQS